MITYEAKLTGDKIQEERKKRNWTQKYLGKNLGLTDKQVSKYEKGELFPPIDILTELCRLFDCEIGYLLGEPQYKDGTQLTTAIHETTGLEADTIRNLQCITGKNRGALVFKCESDKYKQILNRLLSSSDFLSFVECLGNLEDCENELKALGSSIIERYGEENFIVAMECYTGEIDYEHDPDVDFPSDEVREAYGCIKKDDIISEQQDILYKMKIFRYELHEIYEELINGLYPKR